MIKNIGVILAGGTGQRFGSDIPKQYKMIKNMEVVEFVIKAFLQANQCDRVLIATNKQEFEEKRFEKKYEIQYVLGGSGRNKTVYNSISFIKNNFKDCQKVIFHDAVRPMITPEIINNYFSLLGESDCVITTAKITDSLGIDNCNYINREDYFLIQTPEAFVFNKLEENFVENSNKTAIVQHMPQGTKIRKFYDFDYNFKITYPRDLLIMQALLEGKEIK